MMNGDETRKYEMLARVREFGITYGTYFPPGTMAADLLAQIATAVDRLARHSVAQATGAGVAREGAANRRQALEDRREVIGVLRNSAEAGAVERPQPTLGDLPALVEESRQAGVRVRATYAVPDVATVPASTGRAAYRVVQEALTNVRKHAPGTVADVLVAGDRAAGLTVEVRNPLRVSAEAAAPLPGSGTGLIGLLERVSLAGGTLEHGWTADGEFRLRASLPWAAPADAG